MKSTILNRAKIEKNDEYYTRYDDIANEMQYYKDHFRDKVIYCNCDYFRQSNFVKYFYDHFDDFGLAGLIATHYTPNKKSMLYYYDGHTERLHVMKGDGDFRSAECLDLLKESDIVITNPPFSLFKELFGMLYEYGKDYILLGPFSSISYVQVIRSIRDRKCFMGVTARKDTVLYFDIPDYLEKKMIAERKEGSSYKTIDGKVYGRMNVVWYSSINHGIEMPFIEMTEKYYGNEQKYPVYYFENVIDVDKVKNIPMDYADSMGVPITFMIKWNPDQFEIIDFIRPFLNAPRYSPGSKSVYTRIEIKNKTLPGYTPPNTLSEYIE